MRSIISRNIILSLIITLALSLQVASSVSAEELSSYTIGTGSRTYQFEELLGLYECNSPVYQKSSIAYQIEALNATLATESYNSMNSEYADITVKLTELRSTKEALAAYAAGITDTAILTEINTEIKNVEAQISQYSSSVSSVGLSLAETKLQEEVAGFYDTCRDLLISNAQASLKNEFLKKCYGLMLTKEQQDYYLTYQSYLDTVRTVQYIKYQKGLVSRVELDAAEANLMKNEVTIFENQSIYDKALSTIQKETNLSSDSVLRFQLSIKQKEYKEEELQAIFLDNDITIRQLSNYTNSYINYKTNNAIKSQALTKQIDLKIQNYSLQESELRNNIKAYVKEALTAYENAFRTYQMAGNELKLREKQLAIVIAKKEHKRATELDLRKANYEKEASEVAYYQSCYDIIVWQNILDNHIYDTTA